MKKIYLISGAIFCAFIANAQTKYGTGALANNTSGIYNSAFGYYTLNVNTTGSKNTGVGANVLRSNNGDFNTAIGYASLYKNTSGYNNAALGLYSLFSNTTGHYNTALGTYALQANTTAYYNTAIGYQALYSNKDQSYNTAVGPNSLYTNTEGVANTGVGYSTLFANKSGLSNTAMGHAALYANTTGNNNNAFGRYALYYNTTGSENSAFGYDALYFHKAGSSNTSIGSYSLYNDSTGAANTAVGYSSLNANKTGNYNTAIGYNSGVSANNLTNTTAIGNGAKVNVSNKIVIGNSSVSVIGGNVDWSVLSDGRFKKDIRQNVPGLAFINKLRPVTYHIDQEKLQKFLGATDSAVNSMKNDFAAIEKKLHTGLIAQEVEKVSKEISYDFNGVNAPQNSQDNYSIAYADFVPSLIKAVQELSQAIDDRDSLIKDLQKQVNELRSVAGSGNQTQNIKIADLSSASLLQNTPNPFSSNTVISYKVPSSATKAQIIISDAKGNTIKTIALINKGTGSITINPGDLSAGNYYYSLIVNGKKTDTKQMMLMK